MELEDFREILKTKHDYYQRGCNKNIGWEGQDYKEWLESEIYKRDKEITKLKKKINTIRRIFQDNITRIFGSED